MTADAVGATFAALADPTRRHVIDLLADREAVTASELARDLPITRQAVSKHLATLADAGLVTSQRAGRETRYRLTPAPLTDARRVDRQRRRRVGRPPLAPRAARKARPVAAVASILAACRPCAGRARS